MGCCITKDRSREKGGSSERLGSEGKENLEGCGWGGAVVIILGKNLENVGRSGTERS